MNNFFDKSVDDTIKELQTDKTSGLKNNQIEQRLKEYGENKLQGSKEKTMLEIFFSQFKDFLVIILIIAAIVSICLGIIENKGILDGIIIFAIVIINAILGVIQENRASNALKALKEMSSPQSKAIRDSALAKISSSDLVPGDIILLEAGDYVPADVRLIDSINLKIDESALTGESVPSEKFADKILESDAGVGDRINCGFMGTVVTYGRGNGIVTGTGMKTEMGKIATMLNESEDQETPLQKMLDAFGKTLGIVCLVVCAIIFLLGMFVIKMDFFDIFMQSIALAVAAIPEGLTIVVTVILAMGMQRMVKKNAIIKKLSAVETLGSTTVICSDKTGTLTQNKMTVVKVFDIQKEYEVTGTGYAKNGKLVTESRLTDATKMLLMGSVLCNDAVFNVAEQKILGDPTEGALVVLGEKMDFNKNELNQKYTRINEIPFDSTRKLMSTFHKNDNGKVLVFTKGAPDELIARCKYYYSDGKIINLSDDILENIKSTNENYAKQALRVLAVAFKEIDFIDKNNLEKEEDNLVFTGLLCMIDPPREEATEAIKKCKDAGITVKMITGDHAVTAKAIAVQIGITDEKGGVITGKEISLLSDEELKEKVKDINVYARVSPEHKVRLVDAVKANKNIVAMTGDGVNDAPSLKKADIGIAMGITGTDVSKEAADMILTDDNFASIVHAVEEGRTIYNNIRKVVAYLISCNIGEIIIILSAMIFTIFDKNIDPMPLLPVQLLSINLITDAFPAFALGMEEKEHNVMNKKPRDVNDSIIDKKMRIAICVQSIALAIGTMCSYLIGFYTHGKEVANTICFVTLVCGELLRAYSARSEETTIFKMKLLSNKYLNYSVLGSLVFLFSVVYIVPLQTIFHTVSLTTTELATALAFAILPLLGGEATKLLIRRLK